MGLQRGDRFLLGRVYQLMLLDELAEGLGCEIQIASKGPSLIGV